MNFSFNLLGDLYFYYLNASTEFKRKILGSIFPENLVYSDKNYRTPNSDSVISLIANIAKVSKDSKIQKVTNNGNQSPSAPLRDLLSNPNVIKGFKNIYELSSYIDVKNKCFKGLD